MIETERLVLREWTLNDLKDMVEGLNCFNTAKNLTTPFPYTEEDAVQYINNHLHNDKFDYHFAIALKENNKAIGGTSISINFDGTNSGGIWISEKFIGKGYGTEVWTARANLAFKEMGLKKIIDGYFDFNEKSWNMQKKVGYKVVGEKENFCPALNKKVREIVTSLSKEDFDKFIEKN